MQCPIEEKREIKSLQACSTQLWQFVFSGMALNVSSLMLPIGMHSCWAGVQLKSKSMQLVH